MGRRSQKHHRRSAAKSHTLPSSPTHSFSSSSSSSSDFEFIISRSPLKSSTALCPADELFYKGQLLPLHLSPRLSMVRSLLLSSPSSSDSATTASRDSTASTSSLASSRPSSVTDDEFKRLTTTATASNVRSLDFVPRRSSKYFSLAKFSSVFRKEHKSTIAAVSGGGAVKRVSSTAREVVRKYLKKVKPLYEKLSHKHHPPPPPPSRFSGPAAKDTTDLSMTKDVDHEFIASKDDQGNISHSFSGNLRFPIRRSCTSSCPSSMGSSPSHGNSGFGYGFGFSQMGRAGPGKCHSDSTSSMEELQSAIQGAIAHCKNSMLQSKTMASNEI